MNNSNFLVIFTLVSQVLIMYCENRFGFGINSCCTVPICVEMGFDSFFLTVCPCLITCCPRHQQQNWEKFLQSTIFSIGKGQRKVNETRGKKTISSRVPLLFRYHPRIARRHNRYPLPYVTYLAQGIIIFVSIN